MNHLARAPLFLLALSGLYSTVTAPQARAQTYPLTRPPELVVGRKKKGEKSAQPTQATITRLTADSVRYENGVVMAQAQENPVQLESEGITLTAQQIWIDTTNRKIRASGEVVVKREIIARRQRLQDSDLPDQEVREPFTETLRGENFHYDFATRAGQLNSVVVRLADFDIEAGALLVNGDIYEARNVLLRPGGLTEEERRIYGTPPFNLRVSRLTLDMRRDDAPATLSARGAGLYYNNTKFLPVPSYVFRALSPSSNRQPRAFSLTPRISTNSVDGLLLTTQLEFPFKRSDPERFSLSADLGLSARVAFRGGLQLNSRTPYGNLELRGRINDLITTQLNNRIELDREPELVYTSPMLPLFDLPGGRRAGVYFEAGTGRFRERLTGVAGSLVRSTRHEAQIGFTTHVVAKDGPYLNLFARAARYPTLDLSYNNTGFEAGYIGSIGDRVRGQFSYTHIGISGATPFRFDQIEIPRELRTTFDIKLSPRYFIPIDLRYDLDLGDFRDESIGLLRSYKTFAYGITYQNARRELKLDFRQGF